MKQLFFYELKQQETSSKDIFMVKRMKKVFPIDILRPEACNFIKKEILAQVIFCEFCKISNNTFFTKHLWATASIHRLNSTFKNWN